MDRRTNNMDRRMKNSVANAKVSNANWEPKYPFDLVVAYEDADTRNRALLLYDRLAQQLLDDYDFQCSWWKFEHLANPILQQEAADSAVDANMVILSIHAHQELSPTQKAWVDDWAARRQHHKAALVVMIADTTQPERDAAPVLAHLRNAARISGMDFFLHGFELPVASVRLAGTALPDLVAAIAPPLHGIIYQKVPATRWGINE